MEKTCNEKNRITYRHINWHGSTEKRSEIKNQASHVPIKSKQCILTQEKQRCLSNLWKLKQCLVVKTKKKEKTANAVTTTFSNKKSPQRKLASATITKPVDLMKGISMNTTRPLN